MHTSPPASPKRKGSPFTDLLHPSGVATPPKTPPRSDSITSTHTKLISVISATSEESPPESNVIKDRIIEYCTDGIDYEVLEDNQLGAGRFSKVYLARSIITTPSQSTENPLTPPTTPTSPPSRGLWLGSSPSVYAVKVAVNKGSIKALRGEARILSHLSMDGDSKQHIVTFYGFDSRYNSLVFNALPATLEDLVRELGRLDSVTRNAKLTAVLPPIAESLISSLAWMHSLDVVHADIKPVNILLCADIPIPVPLPDSQCILDVPFTPVFADFTSSFLVTDDPKTISSVGGGTYDYMAPEQLSSPFPCPNFRTDVYALAVSLLHVIIGYSPFKEAGQNRHMKLAMIKEGKVLSWAMRDATSKARLHTAAQQILHSNSIDLKALLELGLRKNPEKRPSTEQWSRLW
jgi:serine/threonine protein kinase